MVEHSPEDQGNIPIAAEPQALQDTPFNPESTLSQVEEAQSSELYWRSLSHFLIAKTQEKDAEIETLRYEATHNPVSGLLNERGLQLRYKELKERFPDIPLGLIVIDLASFKAVNDALGHHEGDDLLRLVGSGLRRESDVEAIVANPHGDEYAVVVPLSRREDSDIELTDEERLEAVIRRFETLAEEMRSDDPILADLGFGISAGGVVIGEGMELKEALIAADSKMYIKKNALVQPFIELHRETLISIYSQLAAIGLSARDLPKYDPYNNSH